ncbi:MAG TPA: amidase [Pseudolabrys sp.]|nr:amidase [Pseudolabrys sp.]
MSISLRSRSAFVPHDLAKPLAGATAGPLAGLTAVVKDMYDIVGERTGSGNPDWLAAQQPATRNAGMVQAILDAGATITGKTVCDEFFFSVAGINAHYGMPVNPHAPGRMPGGSSSGSASATAANTCDFALGSDTGGSVRVPASFCGIYGLRPTLNRIDLSGVQAMAPSFDVPGWFANGPGVFRKVGGVVLDARRVTAPIERVLVLEDAFAQADEEVATVLRASLEFMSDVLPPYIHTHIAPDGFDAWREAFRVIQGYEVWDTFGAFVQQRRPKIGPGVRERIEFSATVSKAQVEAEREVHARAREHICSHVPPGTILALPTAPCIAPRVDMTPAELDSFRVRVMRLTCIAGMGGLPQVNIPAGTISGCPVGLSFIGWEGGDEALLDLAVLLSPYCGTAE